MQKTDRYVLFIDESGKSKLSDEGDHILLCGLIIHKDLHAAVSSYMVSLKQNSKIPSIQNIHAFELFEDEKIKNRAHTITHSQIDTFFKRLHHLLQGTEMRHLIVRLDKNPYQEKLKKRANKINIKEKRLTDKLKKENLGDFLYEGIARKLILEFARFLESEGADGEIVAESRRNGDSAVLNAFLDATQSSNFDLNSNYYKWSQFAFNRIHSLTFENKKGLSFGLEIADLFAWAHYNNQYHKRPNTYSHSKNRRIDSRLKSLKELMEKERCLLGKGIEDMTEGKFKKVAGKKVSEFTKIINQFKP